MNAVQGAAYAGATYVFAIDPNEWKLERAMEFGATHAFSDPQAEINEGYQDLMDGKNIRGVIVHQH
jgi:S-(hydroxymethyl)glutathione dehydrogenase/alcohol dehydrogenase